MTRILLLSILFNIANYTVAQTCCSGGVPVSSNLGFQSSDKGALQLSLSVDFNFLKTLKSENVTLNDNSRLRTTQSYILRGAYAISDRLSAEGFIPFVRQTRRIKTLSGAFDKESTFGIGDPVGLIIYDVLNSDFIIRMGAGVQFPIGSYNQTSSIGLTLLEDLQPGSGALDLILFGAIEYHLPNRQSALIYSNSIISRTGTNPNSRNGRQEYKFGNDFQIITGLSDQFYVLGLVINPGFSIRYRHANRDQVNASETPGTGGNFAFARISNGFPFPKISSSLNLNIEFPIYSNVNETQLSPTFSFNLSWSKTIKKETDTSQNIPSIKS